MNPCCVIGKRNFLLSVSYTHLDWYKRQGLAGAVFGTGRLLDDLIQYVYAGTGCRLMLIGDTAQLPPVGGCAGSGRKA